MGRYSYDKKVKLIAFVIVAVMGFISMNGFEVLSEDYSYGSSINDEDVGVGSYTIDYKGKNGTTGTLVLKVIVYPDTLSFRAIVELKPF